MRNVDMNVGRLLSDSWYHEPLKSARKRKEPTDRELEIPWSFDANPGVDLKGLGPLQAFPSDVQHDQSTPAYLIWPASSARHNGSAEERSTYFSGLQKESELDGYPRLSRGQQATTLLDLMTIRAFHTKALRRYSLGTALGFRSRDALLTNIPAIIVFVGRKVHKEWLLDVQKLPTTLEGPGGVWCDVDVVEFSYYGAPTIAPKEQLHSELVEGLRGNDPCIGAGSQVASQETYGTLGGVVQSRTSDHKLGFLTNRHVAVDLDYPHQKMFHPLPPSLGPGMYVGAVERATSFITDDLWYGVFAGMNPETFVRADGAFIPFADTFDLTKVTATLKGVGEMGEVLRADLQAPIESIIGKHVLKVGRSSGLTKGVIMAYAVEYNDERGICYLTDFLVVGENGQPFDLEGDSGSLILLTGEEYEKPRPIGIIWGGTANRGRLKLRSGHEPENWTSGVDLGRLLDLLHLDLITTHSGLLAAIDEHRRYQLRIERVEGAPSESCKDSKCLEGTQIVDENRSQTNSSGEETENLHPHLGSAGCGAGEEESPPPRFTSQEWKMGNPVYAAPPLGDGFECNLSLGGATEGLPSSSKQDGVGRIDDVKLGLGIGDPKRRRFC